MLITFLDYCTLSVMVFFAGINEFLRRLHSPLPELNDDCFAVIAPQCHASESVIQQILNAGLLCTRRDKRSAIGKPVS